VGVRYFGLYELVRLFMRASYILSKDLQNVFIRRIPMHVNCTNNKDALGSSDKRD